jgi:hypothetical protein
MAYFGCGADSGNTTTTDKFPMGNQPNPIIVDSVVFTCYYSSAPAFTPTISYGPDINSTGTSIHSFSSITAARTKVKPSSAVVISPGNDIWIKWGTITTKPIRWQAIIWGHQ